jgi:integrase
MTTNQTADIQTAVQMALGHATTKAPRRERPRVSTDEEIRALGTELKGYKTFTTVVPALYVFTSPTGHKSFRFDYQTAQGVNKTHTLGGFGKLTLAMAVGGYESARALLMSGDCPRAAQLKTRASKMSTLADEFADWFPNYSATVSKPYATRTRAVFQSRRMDELRTRRVSGLDMPTVLQFAKRCEVAQSKGYAREVVHLIDKLVEHARAAGRHTGDNPAKGVVDRLTRRDSQPFHALQLEQLPQYFADLDAANKARRVKLQTVLALRILPYITVRPSVLRNAEWSWINWDAALLTVPAFVEGTKQRVTEMRADKRGKAYADYLVPLSRQVLALLRQLQLETGAGRFLFPGYKGRGNAAERPVSEGRWLNCLRNLGYTQDDETRGAVTIHGFRALFATSSKARYCITNVEKDALEFQQDHKLTEGVTMHYTHDARGSHRGLLMPQRAALLQWWANEIDRVLNHVGPGLPVSRADAAAAFASRQFEDAQSSGMIV